MSSLATWEPLARRAEELGVVINLENVYEQTPEMILALLEGICSDTLGFCLDLGHLHAFGQAPLAEWLGALGPYLREVHLHDNNGHSDTHGAIGSGNVPFQELFRYLREIGVRPLITLEPHEEASLWKSLESLELLWPWEDGTS
jgi:sugar phosphate isomerase/epimerase